MTSREQLATPVTALTRGQKAAATRAAREAQEVLELKQKEAAEKAHLEANLNSTAGKMLLAMARLNQYGNLNVLVKTGENGPEVSVTDSDAFRHKDLFWFGNLTLLSSDSEFEEVNSYLDGLDAKAEAARQRRLLAQKTWDELDPAAREALGLTRRPV